MQENVVYGINKQQVSADTKKTMTDQVLYEEVQ